MQVDEPSIFNSSITIIAPTSQSASLWASTAATPSSGLYVSTMGLLGIGRTSPVARLDVQAIGSASTDFVQVWRNASSTIVSSMSATGVLYPGEAAPAGTLMFFNLSACPSGWTEYTLARGRYLLGMPGTVNMAGTVGTALTDLQDKAAGYHNHPMPATTHSHTVDNSGTDRIASGWYTIQKGAPGYTGYASSNLTVLSTGAIAGTNAPYIQFLICKKD